MSKKHNEYTQICALLDLQKYESMQLVCQQYNIALSTLYKWKLKYKNIKCLEDKLNEIKSTNINPLTTTESFVIDMLMKHKALTTKEMHDLLLNSISIRTLSRYLQKMRKAGLIETYGSGKRIVWILPNTVDFQSAVTGNLKKIINPTMYNKSN